MATVIVNHTVTDYTKWRAGFDSDESRRQGMGAKLLAVGEKAGVPGNVWAVFEVADVSSLSQELSRPEFQAVLKELGVLTTDVVVLN